MNIKPEANFLLAEPKIVKKKKEKKTKGGIFLPDQTEERPDLFVCKAEVIEVGRNVKKYIVGDVIYYNYFSGNAFLKNDKEYHFVWKEDILGKEEE